MKASEREEFAGEEGTARNKGNAKVGKETNVASNPSLHFGPVHQPYTSVLYTNAVHHRVV
jgi:hypothetical protein